MDKIEEILKTVNEENQEKVNWTKAWSIKYPILKKYQSEVDIPRFSSKIREMFTELQKEYGYSELDAMLVLKDILAHEYLDNKRDKNMENKNELLESELQKVAGGSGREKTITLTVELPQLSGSNNKLFVYIDGSLETSLTKDIDSYMKTVYIAIKGVEGNKSVKIKINSVDYKNYVVNFDSSEYKEL